MGKDTLGRIGDAGFQGLLQNMSGEKPKGSPFLRGDFASANGVDEKDRTLGQQMDYQKGFDLFGEK